MSDKSKIRRDGDTGYPRYDKFEGSSSKHTHQFGGYTKNGQYYEGGHGENINSQEKTESGRTFRKTRGDD